MEKEWTVKEVESILPLIDKACIKEASFVIRSLLRQLAESERQTAQECAAIARKFPGAEKYRIAEIIEERYANGGSPGIGRETGR